MTKIYSARWVLPITSGPVEGGAVAVEGTRIAGVGVRAELVEKFPSAEVADFGEAVILPGFVNCHTHLELTAMRGFLEPEEGDFSAWLRKVTVSRGGRMSAEDIYASAAWGAVEAARAGVTCVGDASDAGAFVMRALRDAGLRGVVFQEAFGVDEREAAAQFDKTRAKIDGLRDGETALVRAGLSPHSPYTVATPLLEMLARYALDERLPLMMHAAESEAEQSLMLDGGGPFAESYAARGVAFRSPGVSTVRHLARTGILDARPLLAHCVRVDDADIELMKRHGASVAHCPKSNAKLGHGRAPLAALLRAGVCVGLGSDSVASNNTCDMLEEARFAVLASRAAGDRLEGGHIDTLESGRIDALEGERIDRLEGGRMVGGADALRLMTHGGAGALGCGRLTGALAAGLEADLVAVRLDAAHQTPVYDPTAALVFSSSGRDVLLTVVAGREVFRDGCVTTIDEDDLRARVRDIARRLAEVP
ncbi:MAG: aminodeoxyfutalosine deaminase [Acidobacteriota bacterium]|jgi:5-methylthioadenosine/S-adenosylhomocysteine deaminase|nr:aminodeoxyfutalosine deaminase [Acidobacteriota bacterium]